MSRIEEKLPYLVECPICGTPNSLTICKCLGRAPVSPYLIYTSDQWISCNICCSKFKEISLKPTQVFNHRYKKFKADLVGYKLESLPVYSNDVPVNCSY